MNQPPDDQPVSLMHVCHSCFLLRSAGGTTLLVDPYFGGDFRWKAHKETHLEPAPALTADQLKDIGGIVVTHDHPDHCQPDALNTLMNNNKCELWGPAGIYRRAVEVGVDNRRVNKVEAFQRFKIGDFEILALPNKGSEDTKPCMRMSFIFSCGEISIMHGGDSHGPSPSWSNHVEGINLALLWPNHVERTVSFIRPESVVVTHCDRFEPGDFICGYDVMEINERITRKVRGPVVFKPEIGEWFQPRRPSDEELQRMREKSRNRRRGRRDDQDGADGADSADGPEGSSQARNTRRRSGRRRQDGRSGGDGGRNDRGGNQAGGR